jgi:hypothetical protein
VLPWAMNATETLRSFQRRTSHNFGEVDVRFIALFSRFQRTQGPVCGRKVRLFHLNITSIACHLDTEAWILPVAINATENCARCNEGLAKMSGETDVQFMAFVSRFHCTQGPLRGRKVGSSHLKSYLDTEAWILRGAKTRRRTALVVATRGLPKCRARLACDSLHSCVALSEQKAPLSVRKVGSIQLKCHRNPKARYFQGRETRRRTALVATRDLPQCRVRSTCNSWHSRVAFIALTRLSLWAKSRVESSAEMPP